MNRNGQTGKVSLFYQEQLMRFSNLEKYDDR